FSEARHRRSRRGASAVAAGTRRLGRDRRDQFRPALMTTQEIVLLVGEYRTGLETEMVLLRRLATLSAQQATAARAGNTDALTTVTEQRDSVMASFVTIEHGLKPMRLKLAESRQLVSKLPEFRELTSLHREAGALVADLVASDRHALDAL